MEKSLPKYNPEPSLEKFTMVHPVGNMEGTKQLDLQRRKKNKSRKMELDNPSHKKDNTSREMLQGMLEN